MVMCWLCGDAAKTKEHRIKKSTVNFLFVNEKKPTVYIGSKKKPLQSPDSCFLKHNYNLCKKCNSEKTQPFDRAYEKFFAYLVAKEKDILRTHKVSLKTIGVNQQDLFKYFIKSFCCVIDSTKPQPILVPKELINALHGADYNKSLVIQFCLNMGAIEYPLTKVMMISEAQYRSFDDGTFYISYYETYGWLNIRYVYQTVQDIQEYKFRLDKNKLIPNYWIGKSKYITFTVLTAS